LPRERRQRGSSSPCSSASSLAALIAAVFASFFCFLLYGLHAYTYAIGLVSLLLVYRHRANIRNLLAGTEGCIGRLESGATGRESEAGRQDPDKSLKG
jgi:glycerol-3-phosphate acyltransferase PlsY